MASTEPELEGLDARIAALAASATEMARAMVQTTRAIEELHALRARSGAPVHEHRQRYEELATQARGAASAAHERAVAALERAARASARASTLAEGLERTDRGPDEEALSDARRSFEEAAASMRLAGTRRADVDRAAARLHDDDPSA